MVWNPGKYCFTPSAVQRHPDIWRSLARKHCLRGKKWSRASCKKDWGIGLSGSGGWGLYQAEITTTRYFCKCVFMSVWPSHAPKRGASYSKRAVCAQVPEPGGLYGHLSQRYHDGKAGLRPVGAITPRAVEKNWSMCLMSVPQCCHGLSLRQSDLDSSRCM